LRLTKKTEIGSLQKERYKTISRIESERGDEGFWYNDSIYDKFGLIILGAKLF